MIKPLKTLGYSVLILKLTVMILLLLIYLLLGMSPKYLYHAPTVATGIGAKLACSLRYITQMSPDLIAKDIEVYSPLLTLLNYKYDDKHQQATVSLLGLKTRTAQFLPGIGCALEYPNANTRNDIQWTMPKYTDEPWPLGNTVTTLQPTIQKKLDELLAQDNQQGHQTRALLIAHQGNIIAESYAPPFTQDTLFLGWSMTKSVNALLLGRLIAQSKIDLQERNLFSQWAQDTRADISLIHLLQMTDGLDYNENYDPGEPAVTMLFDTDNAAQFMLNRQQKHIPGTHFQYSSGTSNLIGYLVQQRIPGDIQADTDYIISQFFQPLGMNSVVYEMGPSGLYMASSYLFASARDWAKIGQVMLQQGRWRNAPFIDPNFISQAVIPNKSKNNPDYGFQFWLNRGDQTKRWPDLSDSMFAALGNRNQSVAVFPENQLIIVRLGWSDEEYIENENFKKILGWFTP